MTFNYRSRMLRFAALILTSVALLGYAPPSNSKKAGDGSGSAAATNSASSASLIGSPPDELAHLGQTYIRKGMYGEAVEELQKAITLSERNPQVIAVLGGAYAAAGNRKEAEKVIGELTELSKHGYVPNYPVAEIYAELGRKDEAFEWLEKAYQERAIHFVDLKVDPVLDPLRSDPRFADLLRRAHLTS